MKTTVTLVLSLFLFSKLLADSPMFIPLEQRLQGFAAIVEATPIRRIAGSSSDSKPLYELKIERILKKSKDSKIRKTMTVKSGDTWVTRVLNIQPFVGSTHCPFNESQIIILTNSDDYPLIKNQAVVFDFEYEKLRELTGIKKK